MILAPTGRALGNAELPDRWVGSSNGGISTRASGLPPVRTTSASTTSRKPESEAAVCEQRRGGVGVQTAHVVQRHAGRREPMPLCLARREQHDDPFGVPSPPDEQQRVGGRSVQPVRVINQAEAHRRLFGRFREEH